MKRLLSALALSLAVVSGAGATTFTDLVVTNSTQLQGEYIVHNASGWHSRATFADALTALGANPGTLTLPPGDTAISSAIVLSASQELRGHAGENPSRIVASSTVDASNIITMSNYCVVADLTVTRAASNVPASLGAGIAASSKTEILIDNVKVQKCSNGIYLASVANATVRRSTVSYCTGRGIYFSNSSGAQVLDCRLEYVRYGILLGSGSRALPNGAGSGIQHTKVVNTRVAKAADYGIRIEDFNVQVLNSEIDTVYGHGIQVDNSRNLVISETSIVDAGSYVTYPTSGQSFTQWTVSRTTNRHWDSCGLHLTSIQDARLNDNLIATSAIHGIYIGGAVASGPSRNIIISNNTIHSNGRNESNPDASGIFFNYSETYNTADGLVLTDNLFYNDTQLGTGLEQDHDLFMYNYAANRRLVIMCGNIFDAIPFPFALVWPPEPVVDIINGKYDNNNRE